MHTRSEDVPHSKYRLTLGCKGWEAANRGSIGIHTETRRERVEEAISRQEPQIFSKVLKKVGSMIEEDLQDQRGAREMH